MFLIFPQLSMSPFINIRKIVDKIEQKKQFRCYFIDEFQYVQK